MRVENTDRRRGRQTGSSLIEVLIALLVMSFGMLGMAGMTANALQTSKLSQFRSVATHLAASFGESLRGNVHGFTQNLYEIPGPYTGSSALVTVPACVTVTRCLATEVANIDIAVFTNALRRGLPNGGAYMTRSTTNSIAADLWVMWIDPSMTFNGQDLSPAGPDVCPAAITSTLPAGVPTPKCLYFRIAI